MHTLPRRQLLQLLTPEAAAEFLGMSVGTLAVWRCTKRYDLAYIKVGRTVKYNMDDLLAFLESRKVYATT